MQDKGIKILYPKSKSTNTTQWKYSPTISCPAFKIVFKQIKCNYVISAARGLLVTLHL